MLDPLFKWLKRKFLLALLCFQPLEVMAENLVTILFFEDSVYEMTAEETYFDLASQSCVIVYWFVCFREYIANYKSVGLFIIYERWCFWNIVINKFWNINFFYVNIYVSLDISDIFFKFFNFLRVLLIAFGYWLNEI